MPHIVVIRYCPDIVVGEFVNIGVCVYGLESGTVVSAFIDDVDRMANFFGISQRQAYKIVSGMEDELHHFTAQEIHTAHENWEGSIECSEPMGTLLTIPEALADAADRYLFKKETP